MTDYRELSKAQLLEELFDKIHHLQPQATENQADDIVRSLRHGLEIYRVELEMQNRELWEKQQELELSRDKYADLYDFAPVGYLTLDRQGVIREANLTAADLLGRPRGNLLEKPFRVYIAAGTVPDFTSCLKRVLTSAAEQDLELQLRRTDNMHIDVQLRMASRKIDGETVIRTVLLDVTAQRKAEREARQHLEAAAELQRWQTASELTTLLSHDVNQPLGIIAMLTESCLGLCKHLPEDQHKLKQYLLQISQLALRGGETIRQLRIFLGRSHFKPVPLDLNAVVTSTCALLEPRAKDNRIRFELDLNDALPPVLSVAVHIEQVLLNLLRNAIEAIHETLSSSGQINIVTRRERDMARVTVHDSGPGIDTVAAAKIFDPLHSTKEHGLGVGLRISRSLIEAHGGRLWAEPHQPGGIFHFTLPYAA